MLSAPSLRARILLLTAVVVLPLVGLVSHMAHRNAERAFMEARDRANLLVASAAAKHDGMLTKARNVAEMIAEAAEIHSGDTAACDAYLDRIFTHYAWMTGMVVADPSGRTVCADSPAEKAVDMGKWKLFHTVEATKSPVWTGYEAMKPTGKQLIVLLQPATSKTGDIDRVIALGVDLSSFSQSLEDPVWDRENATVTVIDRKGVVIGSYPAANGVIGLNASDNPAVSQILQQHVGVLEAPDHKGVNRIAAFRPLEGTGATIIVAIARDPISAGINAQLRRDLVLLTGLVVVTLLVGMLASEVVFARRSLIAGRDDGSDRAASLGRTIRSRQLSAIARSLGVFAAALGLVVLAGWCLDLPLLTRILPEWPAMKIPTAIGFVLSGVAVALATVDHDIRFRRAATVLSAVLAVGSAAYLLELATGIDLGINLTFGHDVATLTAPVPGRPSLAASLIMLGLGLSLVLRHQQKPVAQAIGTGVRTAGFFTVLLILVFYLYGRQVQAEAGRLQSIALPSALGFMALIIAMDMGVCGTGIARLFGSKLSGSWMLRRLLPAMIVVPVMLGWAILQLQQYGVFGTEVGYALVALATILIFGISLITAARILDGLDFDLRSTMRKLETSNATLERRVVERTAEVEAVAAAAQASEARYRLLADNSTDLIILHDRDGQRSYVSPASRMLLGYEPEETVALSREALVHEDDYPALQAQMLRLSEDNPGFTSVHRLKRKDGSYIWVEALIHRIPGSDAVGGEFVATIRDITKRQHAEEALKLSEAQYRLLADHATDLIILYNQDRRTYVSPACARMLGYNQDELLGVGRRGFVHPDDIDDALATFNGLTPEHPRAVLTMRILKKDGDYIWAESSMSLVDGTSAGTGRVVATIRDVSARRHAEEEAEKTFTLLKDAIDVMDDAIAVYDSSERLVVKNQAMGRLVPEGAEAMITGRTFAEITATLRMSADFDEDGETGRYLAWRTDKFQRADGAPDEELMPDGRWLLARDFRLRDGGVICVATDITRLKHAIAAEEAARERSDAANQAKSAFLATMSHEIRTPMNGVLGFADLLLDSKLTVDQRRHLNLLRDAGKSLVTLINDILDISKIEAGKLELERIAVSPIALIDGAVSIIRSQAVAKQLELRQDFAPDLPSWILADPTRLRQILLNLLSNAVKFTQKGNITVSARREDGPGHRLRFAVADTGIGVPADRRHLLFQEFSQIDRSTTRQFGGTGLGLAICKKLATVMGGEIGVQSEPGAGSTFWFTIDLVETDPPKVVIDDVPRVETVRPARILVAEDLYMNQIIVEAMLNAVGHHVTLVGNGADAVEAVKARDYDVVLMDIEMPVMDGIGAAKAIRGLDDKVRSSVPIIALTANAMPDVAAEYKAAGMNDYLAKPIDRERLFDLVGKWTPQPVTTADAPVACGPVLDEAVLRDLENRLGKTKVTMFAEMLRQELDRAIATISSSDDKELIAGQAHAMVSLAGNLGCVELMTRSRELMLALRRNAPNALGMVAEMANAASRAGAALAERYPARISESA